MVPHVRSLTCWLGILVPLCVHLPGRAQEKSVRPGVNQPFEDPDLDTWLGRFEREGREVFDRRQEVLDACQLKPGLEVADIGAGTGFFSRLFAQAVGEDGHVYAVEISKKFVEHIQQAAQREKLTQLTAVLGTATSVELPPASIDVAFVCDTYHHFEFPYKTMRSIRQALRDDGELILIDFHRLEGKSTEWVMEHVRAGQETFTREIVASGFEPVDEQALMRECYFVRFKKSERTTNAGHTQDSLETVKELLEQDAAILIDVREQNEWDAGHLAAATLVPLSKLTNDGDATQLATALGTSLPKDKTIYCHCRSGGRVLKAAPILKQLGYDIRPLKAGYQELLDAGFAPAQ